MRSGHQMRWRVAVMVFSAGVIMMPLGWADDIELTDGTAFSGTVLGREEDQVIISLPRSSVSAINGASLSLPLTTGSRAPGFAVVDLNGATRTLAAGRGRVTLLAFWATWCPHCRTDVSLLNSLATTYQQRPLQLLAVSVDRDVHAVKRFVREQGVTYPVIATSDPKQPEAGELPELYEVRGIPMYYLVDANGVIVSRRSGSYVESRAEGELKEMIDTLLAGLLPASP